MIHVHSFQARIRERRRATGLRPGAVRRAGACAAAALLAGAGALGQQTTERVSVDSAGNEGNGDSFFADVSEEGRFAAFASVASNLVPGDTNGARDVFVHDRETGATERVSVDSFGNQEPTASSSALNYPPSISGDGRYVAFESYAFMLVPGDTNFASDIFVHDRQTGTTQRVSIDSSGNQSNGDSFDPSISGDGRFVAFQSDATNLVAGDTNGLMDIFVHDRQTRTTERVNLDSSGNQTVSTGIWFHSSQPAISGDGRYVAFHDDTGSLVPSGDEGIFVRDRQAGTTEYVSLPAPGSIEFHGYGERPEISADGRLVVFETQLALVPADGNGVWDVYVRDRWASVTELVSSGTEGAGLAAISADGRCVGFAGLVAGGQQAFVHDRETGVTELVSVDSSGNAGNGVSDGPALSGDGRYAAFASLASNLVGGDANGAADVFVRDRACSDQFVNYCTAGTSASGCIVRMRSTGIASASAPSGFVVIASFAEGQKDGLFFYGQNGRQASPWGNGTSFQCVAPPVKRGGLLAGNGTIGACDSVVTQDLNALWCAACPKPAHAPLPGKKLQIQFWYRDPLNTSNQKTSLSDAIEVGVCP
jgi:Tol biopolymer transport system component